MAMETALVHRARQVGRQRSGTRNEQGEYPTVPVTGPWIPARVMQRGGVAPEQRGGGATPEPDVRVARGYELLLGAVDENNDPVPMPTASDVFETDCPVLGSPTIPLSGDPEVLNNGTDLIGYDCYGEVPLERS